MSDSIIIRDARESDFEAVIRIDEEISIDYLGTVVDKKAYWREIFDYYVLREKDKRLFLVAELDNEVAGFIVGEARAWEFGSPLCGWVFAVEVSSRKRTRSVGQRLFTEMCSRLSRIGVSTIRTMVDIENKVTLSFYRSQGMRTGRNIELEMPI
ncbi:MAG TPA: GNAT family N-acetyltransferase [Geobacter sp.]|nr:GNAT family N-acetyltransferase [Geobacter sp.]